MIRIKWNNNCIGWEIGNYNLNNLNWKRRNLIYWKLHRINQSTTLLLLLHIIIVIRIPILYFVRRRFPKDFCYNEVPYMNTSEGGLTYRRVWVGDLQLIKILSHTNREIIEKGEKECLLWSNCILTITTLTTTINFNWIATNARNRRVLTVY